MSASVSAIPGGQPSTTQPIAGPWLSPKVVTRNIWPKVLNDMVFCPRCGSPQVAPGLYPEHDLFIQQMKLKNTLRFLQGEDQITHLGLDYYAED